MPKYMATTSFYRLKFRTIDLMTNYLVDGQPLTWWLIIDIVGWLLTLLVGQNIITNIIIRAHSLHKSYSISRKIGLVGKLRHEATSPLKEGEPIFAPKIVKIAHQIISPTTLQSQS
jgi:hypothetical protein